MQIEINFISLAFHPLIVVRLINLYRFHAHTHTHTHGPKRVEVQQRRRVKKREREKETICDQRMLVSQIAQLPGVS